MEFILNEQLVSPRVYCIANIFHRKISQTIRKYILIPYVRSIFRYSSIRNRAITTENGKWPIVKIVVSNKYEKTNKTKIEREKKNCRRKRTRWANNVRSLIRRPFRSAAIFARNIFSRNVTRAHVLQSILPTVHRANIGATRAKWRGSS